jgi:uncharacterized protein YndB with AHSA1/START domain
MNPSVAHETITISRTIKASLEQVFKAWAEPDARAIWGPPSDDEAIEFVESDFRVGEKDVHVCGQKGDLRFRVETHYHDIQEPRRLLFTERVSTGDTTLCAALITVDFAEAGEGTKLDLTVQVTSLVGEEMIAGNRGGWNAALSNLDSYLSA